MPGPTIDDLSTRIQIGIAQEQVHSSAAAGQKEVSEGSLKYHLILWWSDQSEEAEDPLLVYIKIASAAVLDEPDQAQPPENTVPPLSPTSATPNFECCLRNKERASQSQRRKLASDPDPHCNPNGTHFLRAHTNSTPESSTSDRNATEINAPHQQHSQTQELELFYSLPEKGEKLGISKVNILRKEGETAGRRTEERGYAPVIQCCSSTPRDIYESFAPRVKLKLRSSDRTAHEHKQRDRCTEEVNMGKLLSLGSHLKYPITITKLVKRPNDTIKKQESILQFSFKWMKTVGDTTSEWNHWEEEQTTIADWDSPTDGSIKAWRVREGQIISRDMPFVEIEEDCPHSVQFQGLCGMCGKDMTEMSWASASDDTERAKINMIHDQTALRVSQEEASKAERETQRRLLEHRKLSLVVDLDQTIIHACIEPTVGEWQRDPSSPNYEAVKNVRSFQLNDDGPRGVASGCNYYIKMRPGLKEFLANIAEKYELHVYTMGTRAYAINIAKIVDPDKKLFGDRIISRDENGNMTAKSLARLFPENTKMVVIIDDRADVWPANRANLIKVVPYDFFVGIGDINSSFLPKREELPKPEPPKKTPLKSEEDKTVETPTGEAPVAPKPAEAEKKEEPKASGEGRVSALEELVRMGGGDDQQLLQEQTAEQEKFLEKQIKDRPLLHMQEELEKEESEEVEADAKEEKNGETTPEHPHHRHKILNDDDTELLHLEQHLTAVHKAFYDEYDGSLVNAHGGRVAQLKPGRNKKLNIKADAAELQIVPDISVVMPRLKERTLEGCVIVMSGLVPLGVDLLRYLNNSFTSPRLQAKARDSAVAEVKESRGLHAEDKYRSEIALQARSFGARIEMKVTRKITHLVASTSRTRTTKVRQAAKYPHIKIVNQLWLINSMSKWAKEDETDYLVHISEADRRRPDGTASSGPSMQGSDESSDDSSEGEEPTSLPSSQEEATDDDEGVMPDEIEGHSPIDDLKGFNWGEVDDELAEFMGSDSESEADSDRESVHSTRGVKRKSDDTDEEEDSDENTSRLAKKQNTAKSRTTGLKTVKTPNSMQSESSLPTPGVTGDEEDVRGVVEDDSSIGDDLEKEMEAEMEAELAREEEEAKSGGGSPVT